MNSSDSKSQDPEPRPGRVDLSDEQIHWDMTASLTYGQYLRLDRLLSAQKPLSARHDELLFIVIHQTSELWFKLCLHELSAARACIQRDELGPSFKMLQRVSHIQRQLIQSWDVLATMTPADYTGFRNELGKASGFQSMQYRLLEFILGNKNAEMIEVHRHEPEVYETLQRALLAPSLYDEALRLLSRRGIEIPQDRIDRDFTQPYTPSKQVVAAWLAVYHNKEAEAYWDLYALAESLVDLDANFQNWRFKHMNTVRRIIGLKPGTGGTGGVSYLVKALEMEAFPELWTVRNSI